MKLRLNLPYLGMETEPGPDNGAKIPAQSSLFRNGNKYRRGLLFPLPLLNLPYLGMETVERLQPAVSVRNLNLPYLGMETT